MNVGLREDIAAALSTVVHQLDQYLQRQDTPKIRTLKAQCDRVLAEVIADTERGLAPVLEMPRAKKPRQ